MRIIFNLAQIFDKSECLSNTQCGKQNYKSPEIMNNTKNFDAKKNDIWCIGICLWMMVIGSSPWNFAHESDKLFSLIMIEKVDLMMILKQWGVLKYINNEIIDLMRSILQFENNRISLREIENHSWFKNKK